MASDLARGFKFGMGCALGFSVILLLFLFGLSMCAGRLHHRAMEQLQEMLPKDPPSSSEQDDHVL